MGWRQSAGLQFLDLERTGFWLSIFIHLFIFVVPLFTAILLLVDDLRSSEILKTGHMLPYPDHFYTRQALAGAFILTAICFISFVELFAMLSHTFIAFVATEVLLWISYVSGVLYAADGIDFRRGNATMNTPMWILSSCIFLKVCFAIGMRSKKRAWMRSKSFLKYMGKAV